MKLDVRLEQIRSCVVLKDAIAKNFVANEHHSFTFVFIFSVLVVDLPTDGILSFLFAAETDVLVQVFFQSTDVVVINFVVVLKFPVVQHATTIVRLVCLSDQLACFCFCRCFFFFRPRETFGCEAAREFQNLSFPSPSRAAWQLLCQNFVRAYDPAYYYY